jgi:hypothetical protein
MTTHEARMAARRRTIKTWKRWVARNRAAISCCAVLIALPAALGLSADRTTVQLEMKNVRLHVDDGIVLDVTRLRGHMMSRDEVAPPVFDDPGSYVLHLQHAEMSMDMASLQNLMNRHVFAYPGSPLKDLTIEPDGPRLKMKGKLRKGIDIPFSTTASVSTTADGLMQLHVESMNAVGVPTKGLLEFFGLELDDVLDIKNRRGVEVRDNDIILAAGQILPPPEIVGIWGVSRSREPGCCRHSTIRAKAVRQP